MKLGGLTYGNCRKMNETERLIYLAGIIDGEGHFYRARCSNGRKEVYYQSRIVISNTSLALMQWLSVEFSGYVRVEKRNNPNRKTAYRWQLQGKKAEELAGAVYPYLIVKREQVKRVLPAMPFVIGVSHKCSCATNPEAEPLESNAGGGQDSQSNSQSNEVGGPHLWELP